MSRVTSGSVAGADTLQVPVGSVQVLWQRRDLVSALATSEFKGRYRRLGLGVLWAVINPLVQGTLIAVVFGLLVPGRFSFGFPYALFVLAGIVPWSLFVTALVSGTGSVLDRGSIVDRVALPRRAFPAATLLTNLINSSFMFGTLFLIVAVLAPGRLGGIWLLPGAIVLQTGLIFGVTLLTSILVVRYRDVAQFVTAATTAWFWATPVAYPPSVLTGHRLLEPLVTANPMTGVVSLYRGAFLHLPVDGVAVLASLAWTVVLVMVGWVVFGSKEATIADHL